MGSLPSCGSPRRVTIKIPYCNLLITNPPPKINPPPFWLGDGIFVLSSFYTKKQAHRHRHIQRLEMLIARDHKTHTEEHVSKCKELEVHENTVDENNPPPRTNPPGLGLSGGGFIISRLW